MAVWWVDARGKITAGAGDENLAERRGDYEVSLAGNAFLQVNRSAARMLDEYVIGECAGAVGRHIIDAYCGFGLRSLDLARSGAVVTGVDLDEHSIATANRLSTTTGIAAAFVTAPVERALPGRLPADIVVMNPPRRGVDGKALQALVGMPPERVIYVSCNPATLARDLKALAPAFEVAACRAFDLFPQTAHVETVVSLSRRQ